MTQMTPRWLARHIAAAHDTNPEREGFAPGRLSDAALRATFGPRRSFPTTWLALGDSITEGMGASDRDHRWITRALTKLRAAAGITGGPGYLPVWMNTQWASGDAPWVLTSAGKDDWGRALGQRSGTVFPGGDVTATVTGTSAELWYQGFPGGGALGISVDGGPEQTVLTHSDPWRGDLRVPLAFASRGTHTVKVRHISGGNLMISGVMVYDGDETSGLRLYDAAHSGWTSDQANGSGDFTPEALQQLIRAAAPDLITLGIGVNDQITAAALPAATVANIDATVSLIRAAAPRARIVLVHCYAPNGAAAGWQPYLDGMRDWAAQHRSVDVLDLADLMGEATTSGLWQGDGVHPSDAGHERIADHFTDLILR